MEAHRGHQERGWNAVVTLHFGIRAAFHLLKPFGWVDFTGLYNVLALRVRDVRAFLDQLHEACATDPELAALVSHAVPATRAFHFSTNEEFEDEARAVVGGWAEELAGSSFHVRMHRRGLKGEISSMREERFLAGLLLKATEARAAPASISFDDPDFVLSIETLHDWAGLALWSRQDLQRYPLLARAFHLEHLAEEVQEPIPAPL